MGNLRTTSLSHKQTRTMERWRKTLGSGATSIRASGITLLISAQSSHWWMIWKPQSKIYILNLIQNQKRGDGSLMWNPVPPFLPPRSSLVNLMSQRKESVSFIHRCGWKAPHCTSSLIVVARRTSSQKISSSSWSCRQRCTHNPTTLDGSAKEVISTSANSVDYRTTSSPSKTRYCVMLLLSKFVMFFWANLIYGNIMLYMSLGLVVLL